VPLPDFKPDPRLNDDETLLLQAEFKDGINAYLAKAPPSVKTRDLAALIAFGKATPAETPLFAQEIFEASAKAPALTDPAYIRAREEIRRLTGPEGLDKLLVDNRLDALIAPTTSPAWRIDVVIGDQFQRSASGLAAMAGYPHLTVPMAQVDHLPVGLSFIGPAWSEARLLGFGYAFEQKRGPLPPAAFRATVDEVAGVQPAPRR
jgi:amidase